MAKILIIDDSQDLRELFSLILRRQGYEVAVVSNLNEVNTQLLTINPALILLDVMLGEANGRDVCKAIKARHSIPIILISGSPELLNDYGECEADDIIEKPFDIDTVIDKIKLHTNKNAANAH